MRNVVGYLLASLDGVVEAGEWINEQFDDDMYAFMVDVIAAQDAVLLGRVTYQEWAAFWPTAPEEHAFARFINPVPKYVVSTSLRTVATWQPATLIQGDVAQTLAQLKQQPGKNIGVHGSLTLLRSLLEQDLVDELILVVFPLLLGGGGRLLHEGDRLTQLHLVNSKSTRTGGLLLTYHVARP
jgi:dihydrofolate reductase